jgi:hypothetical protein
MFEGSILDSSTTGDKIDFPRNPAIFAVSVKLGG